MCVFESGGCRCEGCLNELCACFVSILRGPQQLFATTMAQFVGTDH